MGATAWPMSQPVLSHTSVVLCMSCAAQVALAGASVPGASVLLVLVCAAEVCREQGRQPLLLESACSCGMYFCVLRFDTVLFWHLAPHGTFAAVQVLLWYGTLYMVFLWIFGGITDVWRYGLDWQESKPAGALILIPAITFIMFTLW